MSTHCEPTDRSEIDRSRELQQSWHGWGSPVGLGIAVLCVALSVAALIAAASLFL
jgi:hypothetical protein